MSANCTMSRERIGREILLALRKLPQHRGGPVQVRRLLPEEALEGEAWVSVALGLEREGRIVIEREYVGDFAAPVLRLPVCGF